MPLRLAAALIGLFFFFGSIDVPAASAATVAPVNVAPGAGSGISQIFTFTFQDSNGYTDLAVLDVLINNYLDGIGACYLALVPAGPSAGYVYLVDDAGDGQYVSGTPMLLPSAGGLQNSQCRINGSGSSVSASGSTLTLTLDISFSAGFSGNKIFYTAARSNTQNSGWQALGTWNVPGAPPAGPAVSAVSPGRSATSAQTYAFTFTDTNGYGDLAVLDILANSFLDGINACYLAYVPTSASSGYLYLVDDAGDGHYVSGSPMPLPSSGTLQNSQCTISVGGSSASASGNTLILDLAITFSAGFAGNQVFYVAARNNSGANSGWQAAGSVTVTGTTTSTGSYSTSFPLTENPISENGNWVNGQTAGLDWSNVGTAAGLAFGTESGTVSFDDSTAVLAGVWESDQTVQATIHTQNQPVSPSVFEEVELRLRTTISPRSVTGYEVSFSCSANSSNFYARITRWNGPLGSVTRLAGATYHCVNGDVVMASITGNTITAYVNRTQIMQITDTTYSSGSPGMGFYLQGATGLNGDYGFTNFTASAQPPSGAEPPPAPTNVSARAVSSSEIDVNWIEPGSAGSTLTYGVYRNGVLAGTTGTGTLSWADTNLTAATTRQLLHYRHGFNRRCLCSIRFGAGHNIGRCGHHTAHGTHESRRQCNHCFVRVSILDREYRQRRRHRI